MGAADMQRRGRHRRQSRAQSGCAGETIKGALDRVQTRMLADGRRSTNFRRLLGNLGNIVRNTMRAKGAGPGEATFTLKTRPTPKQRQALDLVDAITV